MTLISVFMEPAIIIITAAFLFCMIFMLISYSFVQKNTGNVCQFLSTLAKKEISYRFNQLDEFMSSSSYTAVMWEDMKKTLIFPEKFYILQKNTSSGTMDTPDIFLTVDSSAFFNEDSLVSSKINNRLILSMPTLLTGLGPFFTFLKMALAFASVDFTSTAVEESLNGLITNIQMAAICSVFAVGYSLLFMAIEKYMYAIKCKKYCQQIQKEFIRLFDIRTSEQFLLDLVKDSKEQGASDEKILKALPDDFAKSVTKALGETTTPYLENILYSLNKLNENFKGPNQDVVDKLF